ncbi:hypothetical protein, partial [Agrobacterium pusense]
SRSPEDASNPLIKQHRGFANNHLVQMRDTSRSSGETDVSDCINGHLIPTKTDGMLMLFAPGGRSLATL